ncbi:MAG TPA: cobalt ECF transporter T component CbiQ [Syntrophomonas sp.]|nr:cobalt ECF transporter T component CbiQ [Syntrophomonas sp.]
MPGNKSIYLKKSLQYMRKTICEDRQTEYYARCNGALQKISPSNKLLGMLGLILVISISRQIPILLGVWLLVLILMRASRLPVWRLQIRSWGVIPLLSLLFSLPVMFNVVMDGAPLFYLRYSSLTIPWLGINWTEGIFITRQGFTAAIFLFLRVGLSLSLGILLVMTTPVADIFQSLRVIRVPDLFIMIMEMTYRYMMVLLSVSIEMFDARVLRTVGKLPPKWQRAQVGSSIASLFARSVALSEEVYQAMIARCYTGEVLVSSEEKAHWPDGLPGTIVFEQNNEWCKAGERK